MADDMTDTGRKMLFSDHDLLVRLNTTLDFLVQQQADFNTLYQANNKDIVQRLTALEVKQASHMELTNANTNDIATLQKRGNLFDGINAAATAIVAALSYLWGSK
jgi:hypothetical protein